MRTPLLSLLPVVLAALPATAAESGLTDLIAPDTAAIVGMDLEKIRISPFGRYVLGTMNLPSGDWEKFTQLTGFDPMKDLRRVVIATNGGSEADGLILVQGTFDQSKLTGAAGLQGATIESYQGFRILTSPKGSKPMSVALIPEGLAIGTRSSVTTALDRYTKGTRISRELAARLDAAAVDHDAWIVTQGSPAKLAPRFRGHRTPAAAGSTGVDKLLNGSLFQGIEGMAAGLRFGANIILSGQVTAQSPQDAAAMGDVMKFLSDMVTSNTSSGAPPALVSALGSLQTSSDGRVFRFSLSATEADLEKLMNDRGKLRTRPVNLR